jgi:hypothetical protein
MFYKANEKAFKGQVPAVLEIFRAFDAGERNSCWLYRLDSGQWKAMMPWRKSFLSKDTREFWEGIA